MTNSVIIGEYILESLGNTSAVLYKYIQSLGLYNKSRNNGLFYRDFSFLESMNIYSFFSSQQMIRKAELRTHKI